VGQTAPGSRAKLDIIRAGKTQTLLVTIAELPEEGGEIRPAVAPGPLEPGPPHRELELPAPALEQDLERGGGDDRIGGQPGQERRGLIAQGRHQGALRLALCAVGKVGFDFSALRPAQRLVEIGVKLLVRNVPLWPGNPFGHVPRSTVSGPAPASSRPPRRQAPFAPRSPDS